MFFPCWPTADTSLLLQLCLTWRHRSESLNSASGFPEARYRALKKPSFAACTLIWLNSSDVPERIHWTIVHKCIHNLSEQELNILHYCLINVTANVIILVSVNDMVFQFVFFQFWCQILGKTPIKTQRKQVNYTAVDCRHVHSKPKTAHRTEALR